MAFTMEALQLTQGFLISDVFCMFVILSMMEKSS